MGVALKYFVDMACRRPQVLGMGYQNIYVVHLHYTHKDDAKRTKDIVLPYAKYKLAQDRYCTETSVDMQPETWLIDEISITVDTYLDKRLVHSDETLKAKFGTRNLYGRYTRNRVGEVLS